MVTRAIKLKPVLNYLMEENTEFSEYKFDEKSWEILKEFASFLEAFHEATVLASGSLYVSLSYAIPIFDSLILHCEAFEAISEVSRVLADAAKNKLEVYRLTFITIMQSRRQG